MFYWPHFAGSPNQHVSNVFRLITMLVEKKPSIWGPLPTIEFFELFLGFAILVHYYFNCNLDFRTRTYLTILPGLRSKFFLTISVSSVDVFDDVPKLKTVIERGSATPMAYDTWTRQRRQRPALTKDLATHLWKKGETINNWQNYSCFKCYQLKKKYQLS